MKRVICAVAAVAIALGLSTAANAQQKVKIGVLNDMSGLYRDLGGPGSLEAAKLEHRPGDRAHDIVKVELHDFVAVACARIGHVNADGRVAIRRDRRGRDRGI